MENGVSSDIKLGNPVKTIEIKFNLHRNLKDSAFDALRRFFKSKWKEGNADDIVETIIITPESTNKEINIALPASGVPKAALVKKIECHLAKVKILDDTGNEKEVEKEVITSIVIEVKRAATDYRKLLQEIPK